jgi:hypothetical protein
MPSIVKEASAMFVAMTHFLEPSGAGSKILDYISDGSAEYTGRIMSSGASSPKAFILS